MNGPLLRAIAFMMLLFVAVPSGRAADRLTVFVSIVPQKYFVQRIGRDLVDVQVMVQPGANPATYEPKPRQMAELSSAAIYFSIGVQFEDAWLPRIVAANSKMRMVATDLGIEKMSMAAHDHQDGLSISDHDTHNGLDPHIWLSPPLVRIQVQTILSALKSVDPAHGPVYERNFKQFITDLDKLDMELKAAFADQKGLRFMVFHPAWGYFANAYGLEQVPIEVEGKSPKPAQLKMLIQQARQRDIKVVFVQPQFSTKSAEIVAKEIGGQVAFADPLAEDWLSNMQEVAMKFKGALK
jgi:zinc transport system substrate-binding protein